MLRRNHRFFQSVLIVRDAFLVGWAFYLAYICRFAFPAILPFHSVSSIHETLAVGLMLVVIWPIAGWTAGLYTSRRLRSATNEVFDTFKTTLLTLLVLVVVTYFVRDVRYSRAVLLLWSVFGFVMLSVARLFFAQLLRFVRAQGYNLRHILIVGTGDLAKRVSQTIQDQHGLGLRLMGFVALENNNTQAENLQTLAYPLLGYTQQIETLIAQHQIDQVIVALPIEHLGALRHLMDILSKETVDVRLVPDFYQYITLCGSIEEFAGLPIINLQASPLFGWSRVLKRAFDMLAATTGLLLLSPILLIVAAAIKLTDKGPVLYKQVRVGMDGQHFYMLKFRTMHFNNPSDNTREVVGFTKPNDPRCTVVGSFLRRFSLDELPQLVNVLYGDMSLVGPRPEQPCFIEEFRQRIPRYALRHKIKAGMTGWAQVHGMRGDTSIAKRIELDLYYIENWSLFLDFKILLRTVLGGFLSPNAY